MELLLEEENMIIIKNENIFSVFYKMADEVEKEAYLLWKKGNNDTLANYYKAEKLVQKRKHVLFSGESKEEKFLDNIASNMPQNNNIMSGMMKDPQFVTLMNKMKTSMSGDMNVKKLIGIIGDKIPDNVNI